MWHVTVTVADDTGHPEDAADDVQVIDLDAG
jgi:hypothetical protein